MPDFWETTTISEGYIFALAADMQDKQHFTVMLKRENDGVACYISWKALR